MHAKSIFELPFALEGNYSLVDVGSNVRMYMQVEGLDANLVDKVVNFAL